MSGNDVPSFYRYSSVNNYFNDLGSQVWTLWVAKNDLRKMVNTDASYSTNFEGAVMPGLVEEEDPHIYIDDIKREGDE